MVVRIPEHGSRAVEMEEGMDGMESPLDVLSRAATMVEAVNTSSARTPGRVGDISSSSTPGRVLETSTTSTPGREDTENSPPSQVLYFYILRDCTHNFKLTPFKRGHVRFTAGYFKSSSEQQWWRYRCFSIEESFEYCKLKYFLYCCFSAENQKTVE